MPERDSKETPCQRAMVKDVFLWFPSWQANVAYGFHRWLFDGFRRGRERFCHGFRR